MQYNVMNQL